MPRGQYDRSKAAKPNEAQFMKMIWRTPLTGLSHHNYAFIAKELQVGDELDLRAIEGNGFDPEAVAADFGGEQIGWLPAKEKAAKGIIYRMLKHDADIRCKIISHDPAQPLDQRLYVGLYVNIK